MSTFSLLRAFVTGRDGSVRTPAHAVGHHIKVFLIRLGVTTSSVERRRGSIYLGSDSRTLNHHHQSRVDSPTYQANDRYFSPTVHHAVHHHRSHLDFHHLMWADKRVLGRGSHVIRMVDRVGYDIDSDVQNAGNAVVLLAVNAYQNICSLQNLNDLVKSSVSQPPSSRPPPPPSPA
jgi:hypothetical protein